MERPFIEELSKPFHVNGHHKNGTAHRRELVLLNPGPVLTSARVRQAMANADMCHRDAAFSAMLSRVQLSLQHLADAPKHDALLLSGGGTAATEAAFSTFLSPTDKVLVLSNGSFGERQAEIASVLGLDVQHLRYDWGSPIAIDEVLHTVDNDKKIRTVTMIHHETSVGRVNPVRELGPQLAKRGVRLMVDVISSLGAEEFSAREFHVSVVIGSANKCLHGVPGVSFLLVDESLWRESEEVPRRSVYLDLRRYRKASYECRQTPFTPPVHAVAALDEALRELEQQGGPSARRQSYQQLNRQIREGLQALGFSLLFGDESRSCSLTVAGLHAGQSFEVLYEALKLRGFLIYATKGALQDKSFIVANMGTLDAKILQEFLLALTDVLHTPARVAAV